MKKIITIAIGLCIPFLLIAQDENIVFRDQVYIDNIYTIKFHLTGLPLSLPKINLEPDGATLLLAFDELSDNVTSYTYTIQHCNADWTPSNLDPSEYLTVFDEGNIPNPKFSINTITDFTHYQVQIPNEDIGWTKSGNYLLKVYRDEYEKELAMTRRFFVVEPLMHIKSKLLSASSLEKSRTHQEIDFSVFHYSNDIDLFNGQQEIEASVLQNGRWDNAITALKPVFIRQNELVFDYRDKIVFPAGKEFRYLDMRTFQYRNERIIGIERYQDGYDLTLKTEKKRPYKSYTFRKDINGNFIIQNIFEESRDLESDYANVLFSIACKQELYDANVYVFGKISDWQLKAPYKMHYNSQHQRYEADIFLKQGYYNYLYAVAPKNNAAELDFKEMEGDWYETNNTYTILIYYRPIGQRYDRIVSSHTFDSL